MIEKHPDSPVLGRPEGHHVDHVLNPELYAKAKQLWLKNVEDHKQNADVLGRAAKFFLFSEESLTEELLKKAQSLEPDNPEWSEQLGHFFQFAIPYEQGEKRRQIAAQSLVEFERALQQHQDKKHKDYLLDSVAKAAFEAGQLEKAAKYANDLLTTSRGSRDWNTGNAVHHGNLVLGRIALQAGDVEKAKSHLLAAGKTKGSPQLNSFGPNMTLAKELLEQGEKEIVLEYFQLCGKFWERDELEEWAAVVKGGGIPDFRANLRY